MDWPLNLDGVEIRDVEHKHAGRLEVGITQTCSQ